MGMAISRQMTSPLFNHRMSGLGRSGICWGHCRCDWTGSGRGLRGLCPGICSHSNSARHKQNFGESTDLLPHLAPNSRGRQLCSKLTQHSFLLLCVPPEPFPLPKGKKSPTEGGMQLPKRGGATKAGEHREMAWRPRLKRAQVQSNPLVRERIDAIKALGRRDRLEPNGQPF